MPSTGCDLWGMKLNANKTKTMIVSRSRTMHPQSSPLTIDGTVLKECGDLEFWIYCEWHLILSWHLRSIFARSPEQLLLRKSWGVFHDKLFIGRYFWGFVLPVLQYLPEPRSTTGLLFPSQYLSGMIWLTPYLMVWDWRFSRAGPMPFCWPSCSPF